MLSTRLLLALVSSAVLPLGALATASAVSAEGSATVYLNPSSTTVSPGQLFDVEERMNNQAPSVSVVETIVQGGNSSYISSDLSASIFPNTQRSLAAGDNSYDYIGFINGGGPTIPAGDYQLNTVTFRAGCIPGPLTLQFLPGTAVYDDSGTGIPIPLTTQNATLTVGPLAASALCVAPGTIGTGARRLKLNVYGGGFNSSSRVTFTAPGFTIVNTAVVSNKKLAVTVNIVASAAQGETGLSVQTTGIPTRACSNCLTITPAPAITAITAISPASVPRGGFANVSLGGTNMKKGVRFVVSGTGASISEVSVGGFGNNAGGNIRVDDLASPGPRDITAINPDGGRGLCRACLTIT